MLARAEGEGNLTVLLGSSTGRDGISSASVPVRFDESSDTKRPSVQVGDPFEEKRLIEACLTLLDAGLAIGVQDLGATSMRARHRDHGQDRRGHGRRRHTSISASRG